MDVALNRRTRPTGLLVLATLALVGTWSSGCTLGVDLDTAAIEGRECTAGSCASGEICSSEGYCVPGDTPDMSDVDVPPDAPDMRVDMAPDIPSDVPDMRGDAQVLELPDMAGCAANICEDGGTCCQCAATVCDSPNVCCFVLNSGFDCIDMQDDPLNCGGCGIICGAGESCSGGSCGCGGGAACGAGQYCCDGACVAESQACSCSAANPCTNGTCCGGTCVNTQSNPQHCNSCFTACTDAQSCVSGTCTP